MTGHFQTTADTPERLGGLTGEQCIELFDTECWKMEEELRMFTYLERGGDPTEPVLVPMARYFADGCTLTPEAAEYMKCLAMKGKTIKIGPGQFL